MVDPVIRSLSAKTKKSEAVSMFFVEHAVISTDSRGGDCELPLVDSRGGHCELPLVYS